ncbi:helix-turn-helix domain-containing protein [Thalassococcus sp. CAU 1522]|uniref:Helix-turn-helix domain-containing protein n=1 Tax=Thalassococcus arenae TaxID=2851652 RepID=A0ABS6NDQ0_9RHOB|nr:helix-turn-helix transcriptional regulator [Thalassococcus arenae]MBV2361734.1 helix-turn-helix domain-containing protein [Thalassococcus arenae]
MARDTLTGSRIRERRIMLGMKQAELARRAGISASYLNLIEHNRRRIGGKLLLVIANALGVEAALLTEGAEATLIATLREAALDHRGAGAEIDRVDEFAGRFPGWARLIADSRTRIGALERAVETLTDRMTHDPHLAASLHEMLSTVTAIRSAASILAEPGEIAPEWQARFHRNIYEDSERLAETSRGLVTYLEAEGEAMAETGAPQEEMDAALAAVGFRFDALEQGQDPATAVAAIEDGASVTLTAPARQLLHGWAQRYSGDAAALPTPVLQSALAEIGTDPFVLADHLGVEPARVMRRMAALPGDARAGAFGLAICDASGVLTYRKPLPEFPMPRFGAACPLWPLYRALSRPMSPLSTAVEQPGQEGRGLIADAIAVPSGPHRPNREPVFEAYMLLRTEDIDETRPPLEVGLNCRICPRAACAARREPSILAGAAPQVL